MSKADVPAYPHAQYKGLTKREWFIAMAMQGMTAADVEDELAAEDIANNAVEIADATLKAAGIEE